MLYLLLILSLALCCVAATRAQTNLPAPLHVSVPPPLPPSPVDTFRKLLAMSQPERERFLATLTPEKRDIVVFKLDEYQGLLPEQREQRLRALQARVWVRQLIKVPSTNRVERLAHLQSAERQLIEERLAQWDALSPELQQQVLTNETAIRYIARLPDFAFNPALPPFPLDRRMQQQLKHWESLSKADRTEILNNFQYFVEDLSEKDRSKALADRPDVKKALNDIASLPKEQRDRYLAGLKRFAALSPTERQKFLIKAEHWQQMTPEQRESWRVLAKKLSAAPPTPPPMPGRPSASIVPATDRAALDLPSR